jgi:hypothetical protein
MVPILWINAHLGLIQMRRKCSQQQEYYQNAQKWIEDNAAQRSPSEDLGIISNIAQVEKGDDGLTTG